MPRKASDKPPSSEWERHKKVILSLTAQYRWPVVIDKMEKEHNFSASSEQYVAQMRAWDVRKNLKQHEWRGVLHGLDKLVARHQRKIRVRSLGEVVSEERINRSRNRYRLSSSPGISGTDFSISIPTHVSFEVLGTDDQWSTCTNDLYDSETPQQISHARPAEVPSQSMQLLGVENLDKNASEGACTTYTEQHLQSLGALSANKIDGLNLAGPTSFPGDGQETNWSARGSTSDFTFDLGLGIEQPISFDAPDTATQDGNYNVNQHTSLMTGDSSMDLFWDFMNFPTFDPSSLIDLPFQQFQTSLTNRGIDLRSFRPQKMIMRSYGASDLVTAFLRDVAATGSSLSKIPGPKKSPCNIQPRNPLLSFHSLLPGEPNECQNDLITKDVMLDTNFTRLLLFSIANGFAGLGGIPVASILRFLTRYGSIDTLFVQVLKSSPNHVAKSLAENLVKVAIEAQQPRIVKYLLDSQLLSVNDIVCEAKGQKLTAVERAAQLRDCKTIEVLLAGNADVHKSYASETAEGGPLNLLINGVLRGERISPDFLSLCDTLFYYDAKVDVAMLKRVLERGRDSTLPSCFVARFLKTHNTDPVRDGILPLIALELEEEQAYEAIEQILKACGRLHNGRCLKTDEAKTEWALVQSAKRGHTRVVELLLPHTRNLDRALSASFRGGRSEVVDLILAKRPNFNAPAHSIDNESVTVDRKDWFWGATTSLAEALRTRNAGWIQLCEDAAALQHMHLTGNFGPALAAAVTNGDIQYVQKLFRHRLEPPLYEMYPALVISVENGYDDISSLLIEAGANLWGIHYDGPGHSVLLFTAVMKRNAKMVRMILNTDTRHWDLFDTHGPLQGLSIFEEIIKWGDRTIISDFCYAFPGATTELIDVSKLGKGIITKDLLVFLMDQGLVHEKTLSELLRAAIKEEDIAKVYYLLELGANPSDSDNLCVAVEKISRLDILAALLDHISRRSRRVHGLGTDALKTAIRLGLLGLKTVEILLVCEVVNIHSHTERGGSESPLGTAIKTVDDFTCDFIVVKRLLEAGCDPNSVVTAESSQNLTAMLAAIKIQSVGLVQVLLDHGAKVNTEATRGLKRTPLQAAAESGCLEIVQLLLENNADVNALPAPRGGGTALQLAAISGNCNIAAELLKRSANVSTLPSFVQGRWPLEGAAEHGRLDMLSLLLRLKIYDADQCRRAAKFAEDNGHMGCKDLILEHIL